MIIIKGGVTAPEGFLANGLSAGIKKSGKKDLALLYSEAQAIASGAFTTNRFQASPIKVSKIYLKNKTHQAIIVNAGNANCGNGHAGDKDALFMTDLVAKTIGLDRREVLVASTGIIGKKLPIKKISDNIGSLIKGLSRESGSFFSEAILTTDTVKKELAIKIKFGGSIVTIGGACKGVGMIYPNLRTERHATMLCFITTDASITKKMLEESVDESLDKSFNMISVDGDMSTNDSCFILANGLAGNKRIAKKDKNYHLFVSGLKYLMKNLAKDMVRDGEGATKFLEIEVIGAKTKDDAKVIARKISVSNLLKCCIYGSDPNWGRIASACGASGVKFDPDKVDIYLGDVKVLSNGMSLKNYNKNRTKALFKKKDIYIKGDLKSGKFKATAWTCDLSHEYVDINAEYST